MRFSIPVIVVIGLPAAMPAQVPTRAEPALIRYVVDGDTIDVAGLGRVRLLGIDAPEIGRRGDSSEPFADAARERLSSLVARRWVRLEFELERRDRYDRSLAYVFLETGIFVNALMAREGLARIAAGQPLRRLAELQRAEAEAKAMRRGMWRLGQGLRGQSDGIERTMGLRYVRTGAAWRPVSAAARGALTTRRQAVRAA